jgi:hypothetical protein
MPPLAITNGDVILIVVLAAVPVALAAFVLGARNALDEIGKGQFAVEFESDLDQNPNPVEPVASAEVREAEIRQMVEARAYRQQARGEAPVDVEAEVSRLVGEGRARSRVGSNAQLREEVRQLVVARNERRKRQGKEPLDVEEEIDRQLRELEGLGQ